MPQQKDAVSEFMALPQDQQVAMLKQLPRENQDRLLAQVKARRQAPSSKAVAIPGVTHEMRPGTSQPAPRKADPWAGNRVDEAAEKTRGFLTRNAPAIGGIIGGMAGGVPGAALGGALASLPDATTVDDSGRVSVAPAPVAKGAAVQAAYELGGKLIGKGIKAIPGVSGVVSRFAGKLAPAVEKIEGVNLPQTIAEREPNSAMGTMARVLKKSGTDPALFEKVEARQQASAKEVIRRAMQKSAAAPIASSEPRVAATEAITALKRAADPLYSEVRASRTQVPFDPDAIPDGISKNIWNRTLRTLQVTPEEARYPNKSVALMHSYRSALKDFAESTRVNGALSSDGKFASDMAGEIDDSIEKSLKANDPKLWGKYEEANAMWSRAKALEEVRNALQAVTKGTEPAMQSLQSGAKAIPTEIRGGQLAERLKVLDADGTLQRAFPDGGKAISSVADILDRAQKTAIADPKLYQLNTMVRYGGELALAGGAGLLAQKEHPGGATFAAAALLTFLASRYGERTLVRMITEKDAAPWFVKLAKAGSTKEVATIAQALNKLAPAALRAGAPAPKRPVNQPQANQAAGNPTDQWQSVGSTP